MAYFVMIMAMVLVATAIYSVRSQERLRKEMAGSLREVLDEATIVRQDLEAAMENALLISETMVKTLDERIADLESTQSNREIGARTTREENSPRPSLPFAVEGLRKAHPYLVVPRLYEQGFGVEEMAELLNRGQGEIKLILSLARKREACS